MHEVFFPMQRVVIAGKGRLVGAPAEVWAKKQGAAVQVITRDTQDNERAIQDAQILILGAGSPWFVTPDMVRDDVIIFDAGTSEDSGELKGDAHPDCAKKASLFTPVPGGIGPITIAILLRNLVTLVSRQ
jgi:methylenetetrahydrofolate dehydrogenase (NADP+)/methenyltetrahydrofolate cyclohydrolase